MNPLFAHHLEPHHVPILLAFFAAGFLAGWEILSRLLGRGRPAAAEETNRDKPAP